jgi:transposase InsO family protein
MDVHKNARSLPASRALLVKRVEEQGWSLRAAARAAGLSVRRSREWRRRARANEPLEDRSSRPKRQAAQLSAEEQLRIVELRKTRATVRQIAKNVRRSVATVARVCKAAGLARLRLLEPAPPVNRYEHAAPGDMLHLDTKRLGRIEGGPGHRITGDRRGRRKAGWEWMHVAIDDHSRVAYVEMLPADDAPTAAAFLRRAQAWFAGRQVPIRRVLTDNGGGYISGAFARTCDDLGIRRRRTRPYRPRTNGKAERLIQTLLRECIYRFAYDSSAQRQESVNRYIHFYNHHRGHSSLSDRAPISRLIGNNVLRRDT